MRTTPNMRNRLIDIRHQPGTYPVDGNDRRTFAALHRQGLIQQEAIGWGVTDKGAALADRLEQEHRQ